MKDSPSITPEQMIYVVAVSYEGVKHLNDVDRVKFIKGLGDLFCLECGRDLGKGEKCFCLCPGFHYDD